jgi:putative flippase GtrA
VEAAIVHNFLWHERWTGAIGGRNGRDLRVVRFHGAIGLVSILGNPVHAYFVGSSMHPWPAISPRSPAASLNFLSATASFSYNSRER